MRYHFLPALYTFILLSCLPASTADAAIFFDVSIKGIYEDNVVGLLSDNAAGGTTSGTLSGSGTMSGTMGGAGMGPGPGGGMYTGTSSQKTADSSLDLWAEVGGTVPLNSGTSLFLSASADRLTYSSFTDFNMTSGAITTGLVKQFKDFIIARLAAGGAVKRFGDSRRDATAYNGNVTFREELSSSFWLKQGYLYEKNNADSAYFTYNGNSIGIWAGVLAGSRTTFIAGYHYLIRSYEEPAGFEETASTYSLGLEWEPVRKWFVDLQYDHRASDSNIEGTRTTSNIYSIGLRYSY